LKRRKEEKEEEEEEIMDSIIYCGFAEHGG